MSSSKRPSVIIALSGIFLTSAFFGAWLNNPYAGVFRLCFLSCVHPGVFKASESLSFITAGCNPAFSVESGVT